MGSGQCFTDKIRIYCVMNKVARILKATLSFADKIRQLLSTRGDFRVLTVDVIA